MSSKRISAYFLLILVSLIWGLAASVIKFTLNGIDPLPFLTYRFFLAFIFGFISLSLTRSKLPKRDLWIPIVIYSILSTTIALGLLFLGLDKTTVLSLSLITLISPLLIQAAGYFFLKEHVSKKEKIGTAIAFFGALFTIIEPILENTGEEHQLIGNLLVILYLASDVASVVILKKIIRKNISPTILSNISFVVGFVTLLPLVLIQTSPVALISTVTNLSLPYHLGAFYMALISGTLAYSLRAKAQKSIDIGEAGIFGYLVSVFSVPIAVVWFGEAITPLFLFGAVVIAIGVLIAEIK